MKKVITATVFSFIFLLFISASAQAATRTVDTTADNGALTVCTAAANDCSLRGAIAVSVTNDTINFSSALNNQTITLTSEIVITQGIVISGPGANLLKISGSGNNNRHFYVNAGTNRITISGLTFQDGRGGGTGSTSQRLVGGSIYNRAGFLILDGVQMQNNRAGVGGAVDAIDTLVIVNSTFLNNFAVEVGGAVAFFDRILDVTNSTFSGNSTGVIGQGGGIFVNSNNTNNILRNVTVTNNVSLGGGNGGGLALGNSNNQMRVVSSVIAGNTASNNPNVGGGGSITNLGYNFLSGDPLLAPPTNNGGTVQTCAVLSGSPLIDAADPNNDNNAPTDARGLARPSNNRSDIGAFELEQFTVTNNAASGAGSLSAAVAANNQSFGGGTINFDPTFFAVPRTIPVTGGNLVVSKNLTIKGAGVNLLTLDGGNQTRVLFVGTNVMLNLSDLRITRGFSPSDVSAGGILIDGGTLNAARIAVDNCTAGPLGGGIYNFGTLNLSDSSVSNNSAANAAGIFNESGKTAVIQNSSVAGNTATVSSGGIGNSGTLNFYNSTLSNNTAPLAGGSGNGGFANFANSTISGNRATNNKGGGIYNGNGATVHLLNTTVTNNRADSFAAAGIWNENSTPTTVRARNTIIAGNISGNGNPVDYTGGITDLGNNLINNANPGLAPLGNYGGATPTHALLANSSAINAGNDCVLTADTCGVAHSAYPNDQRGANAPRKIGASVDIGAFERNIIFDQTTLPGGNQTVVYNQQISVSRPANFAEDSAMSGTAFLSNSESNPDAFRLAPFTFSMISIVGQQLPPGLTLSSGGILSGTPTQTGTFTFTVKGTDADGMAGAAQYTMQIFGPTAAGVLISGRVLTPDGRGLTNATVNLTDAAGNTRTARTSTFGYYRFDEVEAGQTYIVNVRSKRYRFAPQIISVTEDITGLNFTAVGGLYLRLQP